VGDVDVVDGAGVVAVVFRAFRASCDAVVALGRAPSPPHAVSASDRQRDG